MKCLVFSDSHGTAYYIERAISMHRDAEAVFFLGDGLADIEPLVSRYPSTAWLFVRGNCDPAFSSPAPQSGRITLEGKKIYYCHGDIHGVKAGMEKAVEYSKANGVDIFLFGHTHIPYEKYSDGIYYFNPGSIRGAGGTAPSYGIMLIVDSGVLFSHGNFV